MGVLVTGFLVVVLMLDQLVLYQDAGPLVPALHSYWLVIHVLAAVVASGAFAVGALALGAVPGQGPGHPARARCGAGGYLEPAALARGAGAGRLPAERVRLPDLDLRGAGRRADLGGVRLGQLLELGPQGGVGVHHLGDLRRLPARPGDRRLEGQGRPVIALVGFASLLFNFVGINFFFGSGSLHSYAGGSATERISGRRASRCWGGRRRACGACG